MHNFTAHQSTLRKVVCGRSGTTEIGSKIKNQVVACVQIKPRLGRGNPMHTIERTENGVGLFRKNSPFKLCTIESARQKS